jgi:hypothetical protein
MTFPNSLIFETDTIEVVPINFADEADITVINLGPAFLYGPPGATGPPGASGPIGPIGIVPPVAQFDTVSIRSQSITVSTTSLVIDRNQGEYVELILSSDINSFQVINWPIPPYLGRIHLDVKNLGSYLINSWPAGSISPSQQPPQSTPDGNDFFILTTTDGGVTVKVNVAGLDYVPL